RLQVLTRGDGGVHRPHHRRMSPASRGRSAVGRGYHRARRFLPGPATARPQVAEVGVTDGRRLLLTRAIRGLADGVVSVALAAYLTDLGFNPFEVGAIVTGTLLGSAAVTLAVGVLGYRLSRKRILLGATALMALTGLGFGGFTTFWPLMVVAVVGTLNPSSGDVSLFLPTEQAALAHTAVGPARTLAFAWYNLAGTLAGALGALLSGLPAFVASHRHLSLMTAERAVFLFYGACA